MCWRDSKEEEASLLLANGKLSVEVTDGETTAKRFEVKVMSRESNVPPGA